MKNGRKRRYDAVVMGVSSGGLAALSAIIPSLAPDFPACVLVVQHVSPGSDDYLARRLDSLSSLDVHEAQDKETLKPGTVYIAPPNYHMLVEPEGTIALSLEGRVNYSRPSVDVLFETAADAFQDRLVGVILTGANSDGAKGLKRVKDFGGLTVVQAPETAQADTMPKAAIQTAGPDHILPLQDIAVFLNGLFQGKKK